MFNGKINLYDRALFELTGIGQKKVKEIIKRLYDSQAYESAYNLKRKLHDNYLDMRIISFLALFGSDSVLATNDEIYLYGNEEADGFHNLNIYDKIYVNLSEFGIKKVIDYAQKIEPINPDLTIELISSINLKNGEMITTFEELATILGNYMDADFINDNDYKTANRVNFPLSSYDVLKENYTLKLTRVR